ncbi:MAG: YkgJ family cysteine cluster protein [Flavobacteriales bacterium]|nr:YkgJ family cysteine cluster protein [Flavobacteriales bacterium]
MKCNQSGVCCKLFCINLTEEEYKSGNYRTQFEQFGFVDNFDEAQEYGANVIEQQKNGSCFYLKDNLCSIHSTRPQACRAFFCASKDKNFHLMIEKIKADEAYRKTALYHGNEGSKVS